MSRFVVSEEAATLAAEFEGFREEAYQDVAGVWTIGHGLTRWFGPEGSGRRVQRGDTITYDESMDMMKWVLQDFMDRVSSSIEVPLEQHQIDALASFIYNVGPEAFRESTMLKLINKEDFRGAADQFPRWNRSAGKVYAGLTRRRLAERSEWLGEGL